MLNRRNYLAGTTAIALSGLTHRASAADGRVVLASWGGGGAKMFREVFGAPFTQATGIPMTVAEVPDPAAVVAAAQGRPQHNVMIGASWQAANLARLGRLEELEPSDIPNIRNIPEEYWVKNASGKLIGMPIYFMFYGIAYNSKLAKAEDFATWKSLTEPRWKDKISITRPTFLAPYDLPLYSKLNGGDEDNIEPGIPMLTAMARNSANTYTSMAALQQQLSAGEISAAPYYSGQIQMLRQSGQTELSIALPSDGGLAISFILAMPKGAPDRAAALRFLNDSIDPAKQIGAALMGGSLPLTNVNLPAEVEQNLGISVAEVRRRTWAPNWYTIASKFEERVRLVERIVAGAR